MSTRQARRRQQRVRQQGGRNPRRAVRTTPWYLEWWAVTGAIVGIVVIIIIIVVAGTHSASSKAMTPIPLAKGSSILRAVESPSSATVSSVGSGGTGGIPNPWSKITGQSIQTVNGKPVLAYDGAEYCPYCAQDRWVLINTLSRFGTFSGLALMKSSSSDIYPSTHTFTFRNAKYSSPYLTFIHAEETNNLGVGHPLQTPGPLLARMSSLANEGGIPVINLADIAKSTTTFSPAVLHVDTTATDTSSAALGWNAIAADLNTPGTQIHDSVIGAANWLTAGICKVTNNKPSSTCMNPTIQKLEKKVGFKK